MIASENIIRRLGSGLFRVLGLISCLLMANIIFPYLTWELDVDFLKTKQFIIHLDHYRIAFYLHIFSSLIVLISGVFLFSSRILKHYAQLHRISGKIYVSLILFLSAPSGLVMAYYANGGQWTKISFLILTPLWWFVTFNGLTAIRKKKVNQHKKWMIRSYALTLSAISLRGYQYLLGQYALLDPELQYLIVSWVSWVGNLVFAECYIYFSISRNLRFKTLIIMRNFNHGVIFLNSSSSKK